MSNLTRPYRRTTPIVGLRLQTECTSGKGVHSGVQSRPQPVGPPSGPPLVHPGPPLRPTVCKSSVNVDDEKTALDRKIPHEAILAEIERRLRR